MTSARVLHEVSMVKASSLKQPALMIDFGSTYTKVAVVDVAVPQLIAREQAVTTAETDITIGLRRALARLPGDLGQEAPHFPIRLACSSARGGLRMVAIGLVPELTAEAARRAALGAGARVLRACSYHLTLDELSEIVALEPDMVLLSGGTDGGNDEVILHNARLLAHSGLRCPIVVAGNKETADRIRHLLARRGKEVYVTENVMRSLGDLNVDPARATIREVFMQKIVDAKGLRDAESMVQSVAMPTPAAVMRAAQLLAEGTDRCEGWGELMVVDVGGATTDVHSIAEGGPQERTVILRGLPEPFAKRTVEGDLGLRVSAASLLQSIGERQLKEEIGEAELDVEEVVDELANHVEHVARNSRDWAVDEGMAHAAVRISVERHVGRLQEMRLPAGYCFVQFGKDLSRIGHLIGTGGIFTYGEHPFRVLRGGLADPRNPLVLKPKNPRLWIDVPYVLWAAGLLADIEPDAAFKLASDNLKEEAA